MEPLQASEDGGDRRQSSVPNMVWAIPRGKQQTTRFGDRYISENLCTIA